MPEANYVRDFNKHRLTAAGSVGLGELRQISGGRAGYFNGSAAASTGEQIEFKTSDVVALPKATGIKLLDGGRAYWDHSANNITFKPVNDRDFYAGTIEGDWESGDSLCYINLNAQQENIIDFNVDAFDTVLVGTQAVGGFGEPKLRGGARKFSITATNEAQKVDMLSQRGFSKDANAIVEFIFNVADDGSGTVVDVSLGVANGTHASNADTITESVFVHLDANATAINAESDDGTTEVAATDTTVVYTAGTPVEVWMDFRNPADVQIYLDGVLVLGATVFNVNAAAGPFKLLIHIEKSSSTDTYEIDVNRMVARLMEQ
jgi:predicted RecA/RadA family phage recombinase